MKKNDISRLLQRYLSAKEEGKDPYFDADQIDDLLNSFEESDNYAYYDEVLALGLKLHPGNTALKIKLCRQHVYYEDFDKALTLIENMAETDNQDLDMLRLECFCSKKQYEKVIEYTEVLIAHNCDYLESIFEYIVPILNDLDMRKEARDYIDRGLLLFPDNLILKDELCYDLETDGDLPAAIKICNELIDKNPYSYDHWFTLGRMYSMIGEYDKAIDAFDFALTCDNSDYELFILKAYCLYMNESYEKALEVYKDITGNEEIASRIKPLVAECYIKLGNFQKGYELLKEQLEDDTQEKEASTYINFIRCCKELEYDKEADEVLYNAAFLFPNNIRILSLLTLSLIENDQEDLALQTLDKLFNLLNEYESNREAEYAECLTQAGQYLYLKGKADKALKFYLRAQKLDPDNAKILLLTSMAYLELGDTEQGMKYINQIEPDELMNYFKGSTPDQMLGYHEQFPKEHIPPKDLAKEFLKNKDNSN